MSTLEDFAEKHGTTDDPRKTSDYDFPAVNDTRPKEIASDLTADKSREKWCHHCDHRVTESLHKAVEWGHALDCPRHCYGGEMV